MKSSGLVACNQHFLKCIHADFPGCEQPGYIVVYIINPTQVQMQIPFWALIHLVPQQWLYHLQS